MVYFSKQGAESSSLMKASTFQIQCESESLSVVSNCLRSHGLYSPWNSPGQNTGVGSLSLLQGIFPTQGPNTGLPEFLMASGFFLPAEPQGAAAAAAKSLQSCPTLCNPIDGSPPCSPVPGLLQARTLLGIKKMQIHIVQHKKYNQYFIMTVYGV